MACVNVTSRGILVVAGTPIGDAADAPPALGRELAAADVVAAEDTRRLRRLAGVLGVRIEGPSVSDPGFRLVEAAVAADVRVTVVPGPSAVLAALAVSGLPVDRFCFEGFLPRRAGERNRRLAALAAEPRTLVFFESRHRLAATLAAMRDAWGEQRRAAVCRELTKTHEEVRRGPLGELASWAADGGALGEITLVVAGAAEGLSATTAAESAAIVAERVAAGADRKDAIAAVARQSGLPKRDVYAAVVARRGEETRSE